jgi:DNA-binding transcriptional LysR family regulator
MEMHQIRYFLAVARTLNFTRAAEECNVSQPALTRAIQQLEDELAGKLLRREGKLSHLTELGERMLPLVRQCYESALAAKTLASSLKKGAAQVLSVALSHTIDMRLIADSLSELQRTFAGLQLRITRGGATEIGDTLKKGQAELAIAGSLGEVWERLDSWPLFEEMLALAVSRNHRFTEAGTIDAGQLSTERLLMMSACESAVTTTSILEEYGVRATDSHQLSGQHDVKTLIASDLGVAFLPQTAVAGTELRQVAVKGLEMSREVFLYAVAGRPRTAAGEALMKLLRARDWSGQLN